MAGDHVVHEAFGLRGMAVRGRLLAIDFSWRGRRRFDAGEPDPGRGGDSDDC